MTTYDIKHLRKLMATVKRTAAKKDAGNANAYERTRNFHAWYDAHQQLQIEAANALPSLLDRIEELEAQNA